MTEQKTHSLRTRSTLATLAGLVAAGLVGCGGGGGGGSTSPTLDAGAASAGGSTATQGSDAVTLLADCEMFPKEAVFNTRIDDTTRFPARAESSAWIASVGASTPFRADWWRFEDPTQLDSYYGSPINVVDGSTATTDWAKVSYDFSSSGVSSEVGWPHESDCAVPAAGGFSLTRGCSTVPAESREEQPADPGRRLQ